MQGQGDAATIEIAQPAYPVVRMLATYGHAMAALLALAVLAGGLAAAWFEQGWAWVPAGVIGGLLVYVLLRSYVELVQIIRETLLPP